MVDIIVNKQLLSLDKQMVDINVNKQQLSLDKHLILRAAILSAEPDKVHLTAELQ